MPDNKEKATLLPEGTTARFIKLNWLSSVGSLVSRKELTVMEPAVISEEILIDTPEVDSDDQNLIDEPTDELEDPLPARLLNDSATGIRVQLQEGEEARIVSFRVNRWKTGSPHTPGYPR